MAKKKNIMGSFNFQRIDPYGSVPEGDVATATIHIDSLRPDPLQPRNLLPKDLEAALFDENKRPSLIVQEWVKRAKKADASAALKESVSNLLQLATTIQHAGLINPITVRQPTTDDPPLPAGISHIIVTGERRWWAHLYLTSQNLPINETEPPDQIKITVVPTSKVRALQLIENVAREDLSIIEKAIGILALRDELAQAQGGSATWGDVEAILGISRSYRSRLLKVLKLSEEAQAMVANHNLVEKTIRPITENLMDKPDLQIMALKQVVAWQQSDEETGGYQQVAKLVEGLLKPKAMTVQPAPKPYKTARWVSTFRRNLDGSLKVFKTLQKEKLEDSFQRVIASDDEAVQQLKQLRTHIDAILKEAESTNQR